MDELCFDGSPEYCKELVGGLTTITCPDGSVIECSAGTKDCNEDLCLQQPEIGIGPINRLLAGIGEVCEGFDESTGGPFPDCEPGLVCVDQGQISIPGAGSRCEPPIVGGPTTIKCQDGSTVNCNEGVFGCIDNSPVFCPAVLAGLGDQCGGFDELTGGPFPDCQEGLVCVGPVGFGIPGALSRCELDEDDIVGGPIIIRCADGSEVTCSAGTQDCYDDSPLYCESGPIGPPGPEITIFCRDGSSTSC